jgi:hypothetical protein
VIDRILDGIPHDLRSGGGSMSEVIELVASSPSIRRFVEVGGFEGGSIITLGLRFANRDIEFYSVESFEGDSFSHPGSSGTKFLGNLARFPSLRVKLMLGDPALVASLFDDASIDCLFINSCRESVAVLRDLNTWWTKLSPGAIVAGDDYNWEPVRRVVDQRFPGVNAKRSGSIWWTKPETVGMQRRTN